MNPTTSSSSFGRGKVRWNCVRAAIAPVRTRRAVRAMDKAKADRVRVVVSVYNGTITGAWGVAGSASTLEAPKGKTRRVNRASFETYGDPRLAYLVGQPSQLGPRRNPQTTIQLRDLVGSDTLLRTAKAEPQHGIVRLGAFTMTVHEDGTADLSYPAKATVTLRAISDDSA